MVGDLIGDSAEYGYRAVNIGMTDSRPQSMATSRRQKGSALRQPRPRRQSSSSTWPPTTGDGKPWYVDDWRFGEGPPPEEVAAADETRRKLITKAAIVIVVVVVTVVSLAVVLLI